MKRTIIVVAVATAAVLAPAVAFAAFSAGTSNPGNAVTAGVLSAPGDLIATAHPVDSAANSGAVTLTWSDTRSGSGTVEPTGYLVERRPAGSTDWQPVAAPIRTAVCAAGTCGYTDATAAFNTTYSYRIRSTVSGWTAGPSDVRLAASVAPSAAEGRGPLTSGLTSVAPYGSGLIAVGQGGRIVVCPSGCTGGGVTWLTATSNTVNDLNRVVVDSNQAWAVGNAGTILRCTSNCATATGSWSQVMTPTGTADLYGIFTTSGYMAVVGANRTMLYATNNNGTGWQAAVTSGIGATTTFYGIAGKNSKDVVVVGGTGTAGVVAACPNGGGVCGSSLTLTAVTSYSGGSPAKDLRDIAYVAGGGDNVYAVGLGGQVYVSKSTAPTGTFTRKATNLTADLYAVVANGRDSGAAVGTPEASGNSVFLQCSLKCADGEGTWGPPDGDTLTTNHLRGLSSTGGAYWAVGAAGTIRYFSGSGSWSAQNPPSTVVSVTPAVVATQDGGTTAVATGTLSATCAGAAVVATAVVPARSSASITTPTVQVSVGYAFAGSSNAGHVLLSTTNGATWSTARPLTSNVSTTAVRTVDLTGTVAGSDTDRQVQICVQGSGGGGTMFVDMVHVDVEE